MYSIYEYIYIKLCILSEIIAPSVHFSIYSVTSMLPPVVPCVLSFVGICSCVQ